MPVIKDKVTASSYKCSIVYNRTSPEAAAFIDLWQHLDAKINGYEIVSTEDDLNTESKDSWVGLFD
jgi:hypothetical protein